jgi:hypothetical protein
MRVAEYIDKEQFLASMGLTGDETKYGNRDAEHQHRSYSTYMSYEIMDCVDDSIVEEELVPVVRCKDCAYMEDAYVCNGFLICPASNMEITDNDFCSYGERKEADKDV